MYSPVPSGIDPSQVSFKINKSNFSIYPSQQDAQEIWMRNQSDSILMHQEQGEVVLLADTAQMKFLVLVTLKKLESIFTKYPTATIITYPEALDQLNIE